MVSGDGIAVLWGELWDGGLTTMVNIWAMENYIVKVKNVLGYNLHHKKPSCEIGRENDVVGMRGVIRFKCITYEESSCSFGVQLFCIVHRKMKILKSVDIVVNDERKWEGARLLH